MPKAMVSTIVLSLCAFVVGASGRALEVPSLPEAALGGSTAALPPTFARRLPSDAELAGLQTALAYTFNSPWTLVLALIHPSFGELNNARCGTRDCCPC